MKSLRNLFRIGRGPSSSHTMGPARASEFLKNKYQNIKDVEVFLYGSLAFTGKGHLTDVAIIDAFKPIPTTVSFDYRKKVEFPNTFEVVMHFNDGSSLTKKVLSLGGGAIWISDEENENEEDVYPEKNFDEIRKYCEKNNCSLVDYVVHYEGEDILAYLKTVWAQMKATIQNGLAAKDKLLPGKLYVNRRASSFLIATHVGESTFSRGNRLIAGYAFATSEENAAGGIIVTAPTCGSCGTLPAVLLHLVDRYEFNDDQIVKALAVAGVIGNVVKTNGSISGAEAGCQAEIGTACSMAAAAASYLKGFSLNQIEYAAEAAMEHSLGLTCDPVGGYVQIPCIERNAVAATKALMATYLAEYASSTHRVSFDQIVDTMLKTGQDMNKKYRETSKGGLAYELKKRRTRRRNKR